MTDKLSPAAQAVWLAAWQHSPVNCETVEDRRRQQIAAALRAAADHGEILYDPQEGKVAVVRDDFLRSIAAELENLS